jgi:quercetin dioxygenase-like cupin family protein
MGMSGTLPVTLRLTEDVLSNAGEAALPALPRMIFVVHGLLAIDGRALRGEEAWSGEGAVTLSTGREGATLWRFEFLTGEPAAVSMRGMVSREKLAAPLDTLPEGALLLRGDSVAFPPGGCAYLHRHQGPGIRCVIEGGIRIDTRGKSTSYGPGGAWYETGPDPVFAQAASDRPTRFIRVMILPRALAGKSSIEYLNEDDKAKPKSQSYKLFADMPIARVA